MKKQKILQVHNYYQLPGGEDTVVANEKRLLEENGHQVIQYTRHNSELNNLNVLQKVLLPFSTVFNLRTYREVKRIIREEEIDVVHVHNTLNMISPSVYYAALACKVPVVQTIHNFRMLCPGATFYRDGHICEDCLSKGMGCAIRYSCYRGNRLQTLGIVVNSLFHQWTGIYSKIHYVCLTEFNREKLLTLNNDRKKQIIDPSRVYIKPNFSFSTPAPRETQGNHYLFVGRMERIKGIELLFEAFSKLPEVELHIAGSGREKYESYMTANNIQNIKMLGFLDRAQLEYEYRTAKALIITAQTYEGFPVTIVEAYAHGVPVITCNIGNSANLVKEGVTGLHFQYDCADSLVKAVRRYENLNTNCWREYAFEEYEKKYSSKVNYQELVKVYTASLKQRILQVHNYYQLPGGEDTEVANEKRLLEEHGHQVIQYIRHNSELKNLNVLQKLLLPFSTVFNMRTYSDVKRLIREEAIDIVHVHNTLNMISPSVYYAALACKVPVVQSLHNFRMQCPGAMFYRDGHICEMCLEKGLGCAVRYKCYRGNRLQTLGIVANTMIHKWTGIYRKISYICMTEFNKEKLLLLNKPGRRPTVDPQKVYTKPNFTYDLGKSKASADFYLAIGRIDKLKGIDLLLDAFRKMPDKKLRIAGSGENMEQYRSMAGENVLFLGQLDREQLRAQIHSARAVIAASQLYESFGLTVTEAYAAHKPVIVGDIGNIGSLVEDGVTGIKFLYNSSDALIEAIETFEKGNVEEMGENGFRKFQEVYSPEANYEMLSRIYRSACRN